MAMWEESTGGIPGLNHMDLLRGLAVHYENMRAENSRLRLQLASVTVQKEPSLSAPSPRPGPSPIPNAGDLGDIEVISPTDIVVEGKDGNGEAHVISPIDIVVEAKDGNGEASNGQPPAASTTADGVKKPLTAIEKIRQDAGKSVAGGVSHVASPSNDAAKNTSQESSSKEKTSAIGNQDATSLKRVSEVDSAIEKATRDRGAGSRVGSVAGPEAEDSNIHRLHQSKGSKYHFDTSLTISQSLWWVETEAFGLVSAALIISNTVYIGVQSDVQILRQISLAKGQTVDSEPSWLTGDIVFCALFTVELVLRAACQRATFVFGRERHWNLFDFLVVLTSIIEAITDAVGVELNMGVSVLRSLRVVRIIRVLRTANMCVVIRNLKTMLYSLIGSGTSFVSALILLAAIMYIFGLVFMQGVRTELKQNPSTKYLADMEKYYGSLPKTFWTLICSVTGGYDWGLVSDPITNCGAVYTVLFLLYITFVLLGLMNILNGIFVNAALQSSAMNRELAIDGVIARRDKMIEDMVHLFLEADEDRSGTVSWDEFQTYLQDEKIKAYFMSLELDMNSVVKIFDLLDVDKTGELELVEFVEGCIALRGNAKMVDLSIMQQDYALMRERFDALAPTIVGLEESMGLILKTVTMKGPSTATFFAGRAGLNGQTDAATLQLIAPAALTAPPLESMEA